MKGGTNYAARPPLSFLQELLGDSLVTAPVRDNEAKLPSPNELRHRIILKVHAHFHRQVMCLLCFIVPEEPLADDKFEKSVFVSYLCKPKICKKKSL